MLRKILKSNMDILYSTHLTDNFNLKLLKPSIKLNLLAESNVELFYGDGTKYLAIYNYGGVAFVNFTDDEKKVITDLILNKHADPANESIQIEFKEIESPSFDKGTLNLPNNLKSDIMYRIIMFDVSQSVALDYYSQRGNELLDIINKYAKQLESDGDLDLSKKEIMKFIGKSLVTKNNIVDTLYIFDSPDIAWEDENADKINIFLVNVFDLKSRFNEIENMFKVVDDNLETFRDLYQHKSSFNMELIVIILIAIEIINIFVERLHLFK